MTIGGHQKTVGATQEHLTPPWIIKALGHFDLDPCAAAVRPWDCATENFTEGGLERPWPCGSRVWLNPPFDRYVVGAWMNRLADHGRGTALLHARTETEWFRPAWERADALFFMFQRIKFHRIDGSAQEANSGAPIVLVAFGDEDVAALRVSGLEGALVSAREIYQK